MCGLAGFLDLAARHSDERLHEIAGRMARTLRHRGADDAGTWIDATCRVALGHQRLAILDLSPRGHQPMLSACARFVIVFNGEIYNVAAVRRTLQQSGHRFLGHSDTEVMVEAISEWGVTRALTELNGMFAFAVWDRHERVLHLGRDRVGEKPLYYGWHGGTFMFASELKALVAHPEFQGEIDRDVLALYFRHNYVPAPFSIYKRIYKLPAGCTLSVSASASCENGNFSPFPDDENASRLPIRYWSLQTVAERGAKDPFSGSSQEVVDDLEALMSDVVRLRMVADVPVGAFLSGGIDSSTIAALMQAASGRPIRTFSIGSDDPDYDETDGARAVARHLGTDHVDLRVSSSDATRVIPSLPALYDEPFADSSQIPTTLAAQLARRDVTVCLSGDGGDELFGGYNLYFWARRVWSATQFMPSSLRAVGARALTAVPSQRWDSTFALLPRRWQQPEAGDKIHRLADLLSAETSTALYNTLMSRWRTPAAVVLDSRIAEPIFANDAGQGLSSYVQRMMFFDQLTYLPDDILVKVDRASMSVGLEVRVPLLDHRLVEFAWRSPPSMIIKGGRGKWLLRQVLHRHVPPALVDRPKRGFSVPLSAWLRGPLREWAQELLCGKRLREDGYLDPQLIDQKWNEHLSGHRNWSRELWEVLMFQAWLDATRTAAAVC